MLLYLSNTGVLVKFNLVSANKEYEVGVVCEGETYREGERLGGLSVLVPLVLPCHSLIKRRCHQPNQPSPSVLIKMSSY